MKRAFVIAETANLVDDSKRRRTEDRRKSCKHLQQHTYLRTGTIAIFFIYCVIASDLNSLSHLVILQHKHQQIQL